MSVNPVSAEETVKRLSKEKAKILWRFLEEKARLEQQIKPVSRDETWETVGVATSTAQQRLWFIDHLEGGSAHYNIPLVARLRGALDQSALERALQALVKRHEALRTAFVTIEGQPRQVIRPAASIPLEFVDLIPYAEAERASRVQAQKRETMRTRFDLRTAPLLRTRLLRLQNDEHVLLITIHHIVADGWSVGVLFRELTELYKSFRDGGGDVLQPLPVQYADYALWQRGHESEWNEHLKYWTSSLQGVTPHLNLPTDRIRPAAQSFRGGHVEVLFDVSLSRQLKELAQRHDMTLFMVLLAGWAILLSRLSGQHDVVIGTPVANRERPEVEGLIGFFVNTLALRLDVGSESQVTGFLERVRTLTLGAYSHQRVPFEKVVEVVQPERNLSRNPIFQVMLALQNAPTPELKLPQLTLSLEEGDDESSMFDLLLSLQEQGEEITGSVNFATDIFDRSTVERWTRSFEILLKEMVQDRPVRIGELSILPARERREVLEGFNAPWVPYAQEKLIQELFEEEVRRRPDATAVEYEGRSLSYAVLNRRANQLARYLVNEGVGPDKVVGICVERSLEMVVGLLAILKAGGAYLPLDPNYPSERLQYMLEDGRPQLVLTQEELRGVLPGGTAPVIALDVKLKEIAAGVAENLPPPELGLEAHHLVYVIYTSGSTGQPKGTGMAHRSMVNLIEWHRAGFGPGEGRRVLQFAALSFDVAFQETFSTLCTGGTLVLLGEWVRRDTPALAQFLSNERIERLFVPPLMLQSLAESCAGTSGVPQSLQDVITAGEALRISPEITSLFKRLPGCRLHNHYGPTETHVVTALTLSGECDHWPAFPSIGRPISNTRLYVLDGQGEPVPIGVVGEIYIGGVAVARGYLGREELTAQRFVHDPYSADPQARLYKSGDLGRWRTDGTLEYVGRNDDQVKIRGYRIELGEIEAQLAGHEDVREAAVVVRQEGAGEKRLVAYVTARAARNATAEELRAHLKGGLPEYMIPSAFVTLERLPLTPSGKLDRRALPVPGLEAYASREYATPQGEIEPVLAGIWRDLLKLEQVGRHDNFFELGGHSLLIVQMMARLRSVGLSAPIRRVFESPTLMDMASALTRDAVAGVAVPPCGIPPNCEAITSEMLSLINLELEQIDRVVQAIPGGALNVQDIYPLTPLQEGMLFHHLLDQERGDIYVRSMLLRLSSRNKLDEFIRALQAVIDRHDILRTAVLWEGLPQPLQVVYRNAALVTETLELDPKADPIDQLKEQMRPGGQRLELRKAPLIRLQVAADGSSSQWYALLRTHHLVCDNESLQILLSEIEAYLGGSAPELPEPVPYRYHVAQALDYARTQDAEAFFRTKLGDVDEPTAPFGLLDVHGDGSQIEEDHLTLTPALARRARIQARRFGISAATLFHAAWGLVVSRTSGRDDVVFGTVLLGRMQGSAGAQRILGMFINTLPLRLRLQGMTAREYLEQTQRELVALLSHEQASLAVAQRCSRISGETPLFSTLLNYRHSVVNGESDYLNTEGVTSLATQGGTNYPVTLSVADQDEAFVLEVETDRRINPRRLLDYMHCAMQSLVEALESAPQKLALSLSILPESERRELVEIFNATRVPYPQETLLHELFEEQVRQTPDATAVVYESLFLTYRELNARANRLARHLRHRGIGPDQLVGVCVERSLEMVVALLGILKAGGAYIPLDPEYPPDRLAYMLRDANLQVLIIQEGLRERLPETAVPIVSVDKDWTDIGRWSGDNLHPSPAQVTSRHLAYVIYTSGSTGQPKAAMNEHRGIVNRLRWMQDQYGLNASDRVLQKTPFSFDVSVWEFFWTLTCGARLVMARPNGHKDPTYLTQLIETAGITTLHFVPSMLQAFLSQHLPGSCRSIRHIVCSGEELSPALQNKCFQCMPIARLSNLYGPTEAAVDVTAWECQPEERLSRVPIGRPISNIQIYVLDQYQQPVPLTVAGEIYIAGVGVGRGYLNREELTAERFVKDPFSSDPQDRMYKTGDLGRWRPDGAIEYLGRNDHQVKIRGFRIELGEIEAQLVGHPQVKEAAVIAREDIPGEKRVVAYVILREACGAQVTLSVEVLRDHLKAVLPEYMVPSAFVMLDRLPLTSNGKLDRRALPAPELGAYVSRQYAAPQGEVEEILAGIWQGLLRVERVGRQDNFFELGGHSLLIVQMMERLRRVGLSAQVRRVFESPTLADLASALTRGAAEDIEVPPNLIPVDCQAITPQMLPLIELEPAQIERIVQTVPGGAANIQDIYPLAPLQEGILFHHLMNDRGDAYVVPTVLSVISRERLEELIQAFQAVIDRHDILRTAVLWEQLSRPAQVVYRRASLPVQEIALDRDRDLMQQIADWIKPERQRIDLGQAPLMRLQIAPDPHSTQWFVLLQLHHIMGDNASQEIVITEVVSFLEQHSVPVPDPIPYRNHVAQALAYDRTHDAEAFFRGKLGDIEEPTAPFGLRDVHGDGSQIEEAGEKLEPALAQRVRVQARRLGVSAATLFHAAWGLVVARTSSREDVVFGSVLLGRMQGSAGAQRILGMFINTLPLRIRLHGVSAKELVEQTQRELVELLHHEQASLALAQRCSGIAGGGQLFNSLLNYRHSVADPAAEWAGARGIRAVAGQERTNYPIAISVDDIAEGFTLTAQTDRRVDPRRITGYLHTAMHSLVEALEENPRTPVSSLSILPAHERQQVIEAFNATQAPYPQEKLIHELFEEQVRRTPVAVAVVCMGRSISYAELNQRANQLARYLRQHGIGADCFVGICCERSLEMLVAILGTWKAGGAYVPLDPAHPATRLAFLLTDASIPVVLTQAHLKGRLPPAAVSIALDEQWPEIAAYGVSDLDSQELKLRSAALAYLIYTSGSTGEPKGVMVEHRNVVNHWLALEPLYRSPSDCRRIAWNAPITFDASVQQLTQLLSGCTLILIPQSLRVDPKGLLDFMDRERIEGIDCTPAQLNAWVSTGLLDEPPCCLRTVLVGGEAIDAALWARLANCGALTIYNVYGPTECTVDSTAARLDPRAVTPHIGRPLSNTRLYIVDPQGQPTPIGVPGEIYIGGAGVARGYLNRSQLTAERFRSDPFSTALQSRLYKTGDLGQWRPDGTIEYLGRSDFQVKLRGHRIELGEIEAQLVGHEAVREAAVVVRGDVVGEKRLVAYVTPCAPRIATAEELRAHLRGRLPEYMLPSAFVVLERFPLTPSGKLDRRALPAPGLEAYASREYEAPQGNIEPVLVAIWQDLLKVERVGRRDDFFELGGHSLLATRLISQVRARLQLELPLKVVFEEPTVERFATRVRAELERQAREESLRIGALAQHLRHEIDAMNDEAVFARIAELERQLAQTVSEG